MSTIAACLDLARSSTHPVERIILLALAHRVETVQARRQSRDSLWNTVISSVGFPFVMHVIKTRPTAPTSDPRSVN